MTQTQKFVRSGLVTITLVVACILFAMIGALLIFLVQRGSQMIMDTPRLIDGLVVILAGICVNALCVYVLLQIKRTDHKLIPPPLEIPPNP